MHKNYRHIYICTKLTWKIAKEEMGQRFLGPEVETGCNHHVEHNSNEIRDFSRIHTCIKIEKNISTI